MEGCAGEAGNFKQHSRTEQRAQLGKVAKHVLASASAFLSFALCNQNLAVMYSHEGARHLTGPELSGGPAGGFLEAFERSRVRLDRV